MRAYAPVAGSPTWRTAPRSPPSSRSKSRPTSASYAVRGGAGGATARPRPPKCRRPRYLGCSQARPTGPACGRASCSSATPASVPCAGSPRGSPTPGFRSRDGCTLKQPRDADATTDTNATTSPKRTSGCGRCAETGSKSSIVKSTPHHGPDERLPPR